MPRSFTIQHLFINTLIQLARTMAVLSKSTYNRTRFLGKVVSSARTVIIATLLTLSSQLQLTYSAASQQCQDYASGKASLPAGTQNILELGCCDFSIPSGAADPFCAEFVNGSDVTTPSIIGGITSDSNNRILLSTGQTCTPLCGDTKVTTFNIMGDGGILKNPYCSSGANSDKSPDDGGPKPPAYDTTCEQACDAGSTCEQLSWRYSPCCRASFGGPCKAYGWKILKTCRQTKKGSLVISNLHPQSIQEGSASSLAYTCKSGSHYKNPPVSGSYVYVPVYQCSINAATVATTLRPGTLGIWAAVGVSLWMLNF